MDLKKIKHLLGESVQPTKLGQKIMDVNSATWEKNGWTHGGMVNKDVLKKALQPYAAKFTKKDYDYLEDENFHSANEALLDLIGTKYEDLKEEVVAEETTFKVGDRVEMVGDAYTGDDEDNKEFGDGMQIPDKSKGTIVKIEGDIKDVGTGYMVKWDGVKKLFTGKQANVNMDITDDSYAPVMGQYIKKISLNEVEMTRPDNKGLQLKANPARAFPPQTVKKAEDELIKDGLTKEQVHGLMNILFGMMEADTALNDVKQVTPEKMGAIRKMLPNLDEKKIRELMAVVFGMMREDKEEKDVKDLEKFIDN